MHWVHKSLSDNKITNVPLLLFISVGSKRLHSFRPRNRLLPMRFLVIKTVHPVMSTRIADLL
jgi:hypothetical protein